ncbi:hypothetical protein K491DRAFT_664793 [Lophiostoma macrostomum CBS 122681]|uniref:Uncharacterized protein n=1 Tax=Lophiostoma macrostomum CBS 122681 TaxID=1314788 RepID=A0A6A6SZB4_9PLEO|nr:hypothetical protein K491DRAFT_664793 [Lophiostoma macrostomum CBS 122681]
MDPWGDPWADDGNASSPPQEEVTKPPSAPLAAPVVLNGFLDDAQWGDFEQEEDAGAWGTAQTAIQETRVPETQPHLLAPQPAETVDHVGHWEDEDMSGEDKGWARLDSDTAEGEEIEPVVSEASDSATTIQPDELPQRISTDVSEALHPDDDLSTRPSTSPSDVSHGGLPSESPRTSFEDDRTPKLAQATQIANEATDREERDGGDFGDFEDNNRDDVETAPEERPIATQASSVSADEVTELVSTSTHENATSSPLSVGAPDSLSFKSDLSLITHLFPPAKNTKEPPPAPEDLISSTSTRKAWYRLTRKQTMREFNSGGDEDNYVRVTWANSRIRPDVSKIVSRWATEDRMAGRGPGGGASFYWDKTPQPEKKPLHVQKKASISLSPVAPAKSSVLPLSTNVPAAFNWSSTPVVPHDPWKQDSPSLRATSSPLTATPTLMSNVQKEEVRSASFDVAQQNPPQPSPKAASNLISPGLVEKKFSPLPAIPPEPTKAVRDPDPWSGLTNLDTKPPAPLAVHDITKDEDDEWGEMVESPAVSISVATEDLPPLDSRQQTLSTPSSTPKSARMSPFQPTPSKHASPIVRLKGTVSPTSTRFQLNSFIPTGAPEGPIGPSLLKPSNRSREATPERARQPSRTLSIDQVMSESLEKSDASYEQDDISDVRASTTAQGPAASDDSDEFADFESSIAQPASPEPTQPSTPTLPPPVSPPIPFSPAPTLPTSRPPPTQPRPPPAAPPSDPWSTADFSIFDSAPQPPVSSIASAHVPDPSDSFSIFEKPSPIDTITRLPPREHIPSPQIPPTGSVNSTQRRKEEEDEMLRSIVAGLPDLGYMLRR